MYRKFNVVLCAIFVFIQWNAFCGEGKYIISSVNQNDVYTYCDVMTSDDDADLLLKIKENNKEKIIGKFVLNRSSVKFTQNIDIEKENVFTIENTNDETDKYSFKSCKATNQIIQNWFQKENIQYHLKENNKKEVNFSNLQNKIKKQKQKSAEFKSGVVQQIAKHNIELQKIRERLSSITKEEKEKENIIDNYSGINFYESKNITNTATLKIVRIKSRGNRMFFGIESQEDNRFIILKGKDCIELQDFIKQQANKDIKILFELQNNDEKVSAVFTVGEEERAIINYVVEIWQRDKPKQENITNGWKNRILAGGGLLVVFLGILYGYMNHHNLTFSNVLHAYY